MTDPIFTGDELARAAAKAAALEEAAGFPPVMSGKTPATVESQGLWRVMLRERRLHAGVLVLNFAGLGVAAVLAWKTHEAEAALLAAILIGSSVLVVLSHVGSSSLRDFARPRPIRGPK